MSTERPTPDNGEGHDGTAAHEDARAEARAADQARGGEPRAGGARRRPRLAVGAVAAAVLLAGGGGAYLATGASGGSGEPRASEGSPPVLSLDGYSPGDAASGTAASSGAPGIAPGEPDPNGPGYRADEGALPKGPDKAAVYKGGGTVGADAVRRLARALGLAGEPRQTGASWQVGPDGDGAGPQLRVSRQAPGAWTYTALGSNGSDDCRRGETCSVSPDGQHGDPVDAAAAKAAAAPVLKAVGESDAKVDTDQLMGSVRVVDADPVVDGLPTYGWATALRVGTDGHITGGSGRLTVPQKGDTYPVLSAKETLDRLNAARGGGGGGREAPGGCASTEPLQKDQKDQKGQKDLKEMPCAGPAKQPRQQVEDADFGLAARYVDGRPALVPSWLYEVGSGDSARTVPYPAVAPKYLGEQEGGTPTSTALTSYAAAGRSLTVRFEAGVCAHYSVSARETGDTVEVTVHESGGKGVCIDLARVYERTVTLDEPVGERTVVDGDHKPVRAE